MEKWDKEFKAVALSEVQATSPLPALRLHRLAGRRGG